MRHSHHITVGGSPWCDWLGTNAGQTLLDRDPAVPCRCGFRSAAAAKRAAKALRPHFKRGVVSAQTGPCPASEG